MKDEIRRIYVSFVISVVSKYKLNENYFNVFTIFKYEFFNNSNKQLAIYRILNSWVNDSEENIPYAFLSYVNNFTMTP